MMLQELRRAAGKQAKVLNKLIFSQKGKEDFDENLKELLGHSPLRLLWGHCLGFCWGWVCIREH